MDPVSAVSIGFSSIKGASEITKGILNLSKDVAVKEKASELLNIIINIQHSGGRDPYSPAAARTTKR